MGTIPAPVARLARRIAPRHKPSFLIIGAQKSGTTSLYHHLRQHPMVSGSIPKEVHFFERDERYTKGEGFYHQAFYNLRRPFARQVYFEATPDYLYRHGVAERIHAYNPELRLIVLLRNPVDRAYSSWNMYRDFQVQDRIPRLVKEAYLAGAHNNIHRELYETEAYPSFAACVDQEMARMDDRDALQEPSFLRRGIYHQQLQRYIDLFGRDRIAVFGFRQLTGDPARLLRQVEDFLELPHYDWSALEAKRYHARPYEDRLDEAVRKRLETFYQPHNETLLRMLGITELDW